VLTKINSIWLSVNRASCLNYFVYTETANIGGDIYQKLRGLSRCPRLVYM